MSRAHRALLSIIVAIAAAAHGFAAAANAYPSKPIKLLVGFAPGGSTDIVARLLASDLSTELGQPVIVENRSGAGGRIAVDAAAKSAGDGYTLLMGTAGTVVQLATGEKLPFDLFRDFVTVVRVAENPHVLVVASSIPAKTASGLAALARSGDMSYASAGEFTSLHIAGALFGVVAHARLVHVPYKSGGPALTDLLAGRVQMMFGDLPTVLPYVKSGGLRAIAVTGEQRSPLMPGVPTMAEAGYGSVDTSSWFGIMAPAATPPEIVEMLNLRINRILGREAVRARFTELGLTPIGGTPADFARFLRGNVEFWKHAVEMTGTTLR
ncbi:MAG TPA: tripartite tricarboxylate transporter substrate binding protein [Usitatibacter sp.]|jgi:tripartite-type tricarboxylate transporter receptor subunit TctC|nr:tripartite tricarboxylate transporter substrate binding protein [Usitatibacter sp.]